MKRERHHDLVHDAKLDTILAILPEHVRQAVEQSLAPAGCGPGEPVVNGPITSFYLGDEQQRQEFLWQYYWQGEAMLFAAVNHIWNSLEGNRSAHCAMVGSLSGTGGSGKAALALTLQQFLQLCLAFNADLPRLDDYPDVDSWHRACVRCWEDDAAHARAQCKRYSAILDGRKPDAQSR